MTRYVVQNNWSFPRTEDGWKDSPARRPSDDLSRTIQGMIEMSNLARLVCDLRVLDTQTGKVVAFYNVELDYRLPGCRWRAIQRRSYALWEQAGSPASDGQEFWFQAEKEIGFVNTNKYYLAEDPA